ncbi:MAG: replication initiator protein [Microvirus sp.]|nr:MAG: replication initiator protein [Microvirus sp.]
MMCRKPFLSEQGAFPCGQCEPCRASRRRQWASRLELESVCHSQSSFVTLTYSDQNMKLLNVGSVTEPCFRGTLVPRDLQSFLKRFRRAIAPLRIRFFAVGEYGARTFRPHYHAILFGWPGCSNGRTKRVVGSGGPDWSNCCGNCSVVGRAWRVGGVDVGSVTQQSLAYVAQYTTKKMTSAGDFRLRGRYPEFARMSLSPGIGSEAMWNVASCMFEFRLDESLDDVPVALSRGRLVLGRYLRDKLRERVGRLKGAPQAVRDRMAKELQLVRSFAWSAGISVKETLSLLDEGRYAAFIAKSKIYQRRNVL